MSFRKYIYSVIINYEHKQKLHKKENSMEPPAGSFNIHAHVRELGSADTPEKLLPHFTHGRLNAANIKAMTASLEFFLEEHEKDFNGSDVSALRNIKETLSKMLKRWFNRVDVSPTMEKIDSLIKRILRKEEDYVNEETHLLPKEMRNLIVDYGLLDMTPKEAAALGASSCRELSPANRDNIHDFLEYATVEQRDHFFQGAIRAYCNATEEDFGSTYRLVSLIGLLPKTLKVFSLSNCNLSGKMFSYKALSVLLLEELAICCPNLKSLSLKGCDTFGSNGSNLYEVFQGREPILPDLEEINVSQGARRSYLYEFLYWNMPKLKKLDIRNDRIKFTEENAQYIRDHYTPMGVQVLILPGDEYQDQVKEKEIDEEGKLD